MYIIGYYFGNRYKYLSLKKIRADKTPAYIKSKTSLHYVGVQTQFSDLLEFILSFSYQSFNFSLLLHIDSDELIMHRSLTLNFTLQASWRTNHRVWIVKCLKSRNVNSRSCSCKFFSCKFSYSNRRPKKWLRRLNFFLFRAGVKPA